MSARPGGARSTSSAGGKAALRKADTEPRPRAVRLCAPLSQERAEMGACVAAEPLGRCCTQTLKGRRFSIAPLQAGPYRRFAQGWGGAERRPEFWLEALVRPEPKGASTPFPCLGATWTQRPDPRGKGRGASLRSSSCARNGD